MIPSAERVVGDYLRANLGDIRVVGTSPARQDDPWVRITLIADPPTDGGIADHQIEAMLQIDIFAGRRGTQKTADDLRRQVRELLRVANLATHSGAVVSGAEVTSTARVPDIEFEPAMERYSMTATVWIHG